MPNEVFEKGEKSRLGASHTLRRGEQAGEEGSTHAANTMKLEHLHAIIHMQPLIHILHQRAHHRRQEANHRREPHAHIARRGRNADQPGNRALARAHDTEPPLMPDVVDEDPAKRARGGGRVGVEGGVHGAHARVEGRAAVEAEPAEPDEHGAQEHEGGVVRLAVRRVLGVLLALAQHQRVRQRRPPTGDVHGAAAGKVERGQGVQPAVGVPRPAGDGAVDNGRPPEAEHERGHDASALKGAAHHDLDRAGAKEQLVQTKNNVWDGRVADARGGDDVLHAEVGQVADKGPRGTAVGQGKPPKHPLEGGDGADHEGLEEEGQGGLAAGHAAVEEADAGDDEPDDEAAEDEVRVVVFVAHVLGVDVHGQRVAAVGHGRIVNWLCFGGARSVS